MSSVTPNERSPLRFGLFLQSSPPTGANPLPIPPLWDTGNLLRRNKGRLNFLSAEPILKTYRMSDELRIRPGLRLR